MLTYVGLLSVFVQGFLIRRLTKQFREDVLISASIILMALSRLGWALVPSVIWLLVILTPTAISGGLLNTLLSSTLTKAVQPQEIGGILGFSAAIESSTRIVAPILGGYLLGSLGAWALGAFGALLLTTLSVYVWRVIYNHPIAAEIRARTTMPTDPAGRQ